VADLLAGGDLDVVILSGRLTADSRRFVSRAARRAWDVRRARPHRRSHQRAPATEPISYLRTAEVADLLHVPPKTVSRWAKEGKLPFLSRGTVKTHLSRVDAKFGSPTGRSLPRSPAPSGQGRRLPRRGRAVTETVRTKRGRLAVR
jgi:excisionase family DNA binding protein